MLLSPEPIYHAFNIVGTVAFAISGALVAIRRRLDLSGALLLAFLTGNGGGTVRDLILRLPVFWTVHTFYIYLTFAAGFLTFGVYYFYSNWIRSKLFTQVLLWVDACGLAAFAIGGTSKAIQAHQSWVVAIMMGTLTAVGGGILRDILANEIPMVLRSQLYATPALLGSLFYFWLVYAHHPSLAIIVSAFTVLGLRMAGVYFNWHLPAIRTRQGR